jgi:uncharacterized protein YqgV (UPF0045/DUF77 family)
VIVEIECIPQPLGTAEQPYAHVDAAIRVIQSSGLHHEVEALGTTIQGSPDEVWPLLRRVHEACLEAGADGLVSVIKVAQNAATREPLTLEGVTGPWRR